MPTPGSNLLNKALRVIASQSIVYLAFVSRTETENLMLVPKYALPVTLRGSVQPVPRTLMQILGLDMQRNYVNIFISNKAIDIQRDISSDKFQFGGAIYQGISSTPWIALDGWNQMLAVQVPNA